MHGHAWRKIRVAGKHDRKANDRAADRRLLQTDCEEASNQRLGRKHSQVQTDRPQFPASWLLRWKLTALTWLRGSRHIETGHYPSVSLAQQENKWQVTSKSVWDGANPERVSDGDPLPRRRPKDWNETNAKFGSKNGQSQSENHGTINSDFWGCLTEQRENLINQGRVSLQDQRRWRADPAKGQYRLSRRKTKNLRWTLQLKF